MTEKRGLVPRKGMFFEEFEIGQAITSLGRTVTEADVVAFAAFTGDWTSLHTDVVYAAQTLYGQRVAHGLMVLSIASGLAVRMGFLEDTILAFREMRDWKFSQPVFIGDTLRVRIVVNELRAVRRLGGGLVTMAVDILNQEDKVVQHGSWTMLVRGLPQED
jgi:3-hydroxybutyryl-CoA dehydratase